MSQNYNYDFYNRINSNISPELYHYVNYLYYSNDLLRQMINVLHTNNINFYNYLNIILNNPQNYSNNPQSYNNYSQTYSNNTQTYNNHPSTPVHNNEPYVYSTPSPRNNNETPLNYNHNNSPINEPVLESNDEFVDYNNNPDLTRQFQDILTQILRDAQDRENLTNYNYMIENSIDVKMFYEINNPINTSCPILQTDFEEDDYVIVLKECNHIFNEDAIQNWLKAHHTCPVCRKNLMPNTNNNSTTRNRTYRFYF